MTISVQIWTSQYEVTIRWINHPIWEAEYWSGGIPGVAEPVELRWRSHDSLHPAYHAMLLTKSFFANFSVLLFVNTFSLSFSIFAH